MVGSAPVRLSLCQNGGGLETMMQSWRSVLFRGPSSFEPIFDGVLNFRMNNRLTMNGAAPLIHALRIHRVIAIQLVQFGVCISVALDVSADRISVAAQAISNLRNRHFGFKPLRKLVPFAQF